MAARGTAADPHRTAPPRVHRRCSRLHLRSSPQVIGTAFSTAPMSHVDPCGRVTPLSSVSGGGHPCAASSAGLPARGACVCRKEGPGELYCSEPRRGLVFGRSPATVGVQELPLSMLWPSDMISPLQSWGVFAARMVFRTSTLPNASLEVPPPVGGPGAGGGLVLSR